MLSKYLPTLRWNINLNNRLKVKIFKSHTIISYVWGKILRGDPKFQNILFGILFQWFESSLQESGPTHSPDENPDEEIVDKTNEKIKKVKKSSDSNCVTFWDKGHHRWTLYFTLYWIFTYIARCTCLWTKITHIYQYTKDVSWQNIGHYLNLTPLHKFILISINLPIFFSFKPVSSSIFSLRNCITEDLIRYFG